LLSAGPAVVRSIKDHLTTEGLIAADDFHNPDTIGAEGYWSTVALVKTSKASHLRNGSGCYKACAKERLDRSEQAIACSGGRD
jgi:hypothetical protein